MTIEQINSAIRKLEKRKDEVRRLRQYDEEIAMNKITWVVIIEAATQLLLLIREYFFRDGEFKQPSKLNVFKWIAFGVKVIGIAIVLVKKIS